ncbi:unnamed protein product, partial [Rotaria magnacalcarata]
DRLSGYVVAKASPTNTAQDTARILMEEIILVHGSPDTIITDQGTHFKNELLQAISNLIGCKHIFRHHIIHKQMGKLNDGIRHLPHKSPNIATLI